MASGYKTFPQALKRIDATSFMSELKLRPPEEKSGFLGCARDDSLKNEKLETEKHGSKDPPLQRGILKVVHSRQFTVNSFGKAEKGRGEKQVPRLRSG